jgi:3-oxosteroid 1-dehydrogenase
MAAGHGDSRSFDVIVVGSGAGGMTAALRAHDLGQSVLLIEKSDLYGGTSALSGGGIWIPLNPQIFALGGEDNFDDALRYVKAATRGMVPEPRLTAYLKSGPAMLAWLAERTRLKFHALPKYPDYYPALAGARPGYRTMEPAFFSARSLGGEAARLRPPTPGTLLFKRVYMGQAEAAVLFTRARGWVGLLLRILLAYGLDLPARLAGKPDQRLALGSALVAALRRSMMDRKIPLWLDTSLESLIEVDGRVTGVVVQHEGRSLRLQARKGVILAAGGFERNQAMREQYLPKPSRAEWSAAQPNNTGDAIRAGMALGAGVDFMDRVWGAPTVWVPGEEKQQGLFAERSSPGCVVVNRAGRRFVNEAEPYLEFVEAMYADHAKTGGSVPCWMIFDASFRHKYAAGPLLPAQMTPDSRLPGDWLGQVYWRAGSIAELAGQLGVDAAELARTVARMNDYARTGVDLEFHKGENVFDRYYGDPAVTPNPCLGPILKPPFYALKLDAGDIGTKGGLLADEDARVLNAETRLPIGGLYAIGNTSAAAMGPAYPGPGATLGPAMVFGYRAANHLAATNA